MQRRNGQKAADDNAFAQFCPVLNSSRPRQEYFKIAFEFDQIDLTYFEPGLVQDLWSLKPELS
jgi:hypothetical protein